MDCFNQRWHANSSRSSRSKCSLLNLVNHLRRFTLSNNTLLINGTIYFALCTTFYFFLSEYKKNQMMKGDDIFHFNREIKHLLFIIPIIDRKERPVDMPPFRICHNVINFIHVRIEITCYNTTY